MNQCSVALWAAAIACLGSGAAAQTARAGKTSQPKPDLHGGGAKPSAIPNHQATLVTIPGFHFTGAQVTAHGACRVVNYQVASDNELRITFEGTRGIDQDDGCFYDVRTAAGSTGSWIVVNLTGAEEKEKAARKEAAGRAVFNDLVGRLGREWHIRFADGGTETYTMLPRNPDDLPKFQSGNGSPVEIMVDQKSLVIIIDGQCMLNGHLADDRVQGCQGQGNCKHSVPWSATVQR